MAVRLVPSGAVEFVHHVAAVELDSEQPSTPKGEVSTDRCAEVRAVPSAHNAWSEGHGPSRDPGSIAANVDGDGGVVVAVRPGPTLGWEDRAAPGEVEKGAHAEPQRHAPDPHAAGQREVSESVPGTPCWANLPKRLEAGEGRRRRLGVG